MSHDMSCGRYPGQWPEGAGWELLFLFLFLCMTTSCPNPGRADLGTKRELAQGTGEASSAYLSSV